MPFDEIEGMKARPGGTSRRRRAVGGEATFFTGKSPAGNGGSR